MSKRNWLLAFPLYVVSALTLAQTPSGASWNFPSFSRTGTYTIVSIGGGVNQLQAGNETFITITPAVVPDAPYPGCAYTDTVANTSILLVPNYYLDVNGVPQWSNGTNPVAQAFHTEFLAHYLTGMPLTQINFFLIQTNSNICVVKSFIG